MLNIYRGNRAEWLAKLLGEQLRITPPSPLEKLNIIVNSQTTDVERKKNSHIIVTNNKGKNQYIKKINKVLERLV